MGISLLISHLQSSICIWPGLHCFHFPVLYDGNVDLMNTCRDAKPVSLALIQINSLMFCIQQHPVLYPAHPLRHFCIPFCCCIALMPNFVICKHANHSTCFPEMFSFDERELKLVKTNNDTLIRWVISLFSL